MTVEADLFTALKGLVGNRCYPDQAPEQVTLPYIVYQQVGGVAPAFMERALPSVENARFQISVWAASRAQSKAIAKQAEEALIAATAFQATRLGAPVSDFERDTKRFGSRQDFSVWSPR